MTGLTPVLEKKSSLQAMQGHVVQYGEAMARYGH